MQIKTVPPYKLMYPNCTSHGRFFRFRFLVEGADTVRCRRQTGPRVDVSARRRTDGNGRVASPYRQPVDAAIVAEVLVSQHVVERRPCHDVGDLVLETRLLDVLVRARRRRLVVPPRPAVVEPRRVVVSGGRAEIAVEVAGRLVGCRRQIVEGRAGRAWSVGVQLDLVDRIGARLAERDAGHVQASAAVVVVAQRRSTRPLQAHVVCLQRRAIGHDRLAAGAEGRSYRVAPLEVLLLAGARLQHGEADEDEHDEEDAADDGQDDDDGPPVERRRHVRV